MPAIRAAIGAPYRWARMRYRRDGDVVTYEARLRRLGDRPASRVVVRVGAEREATPLDDFLTARWGAHVARRRGTTYVPNHARALDAAGREVLELDDGLLASVGLPGHRRPARRTTSRSATGSTQSSADRAEWGR